MASNNDSDTGSFLVGFIIGGLVGAAVALILAPQSGAETREQIRQKGIELKEQGEETLTEARAKAEAAAAEARARAEKLAGDAKTRAQELAKQGREVFDEQRSKLQDAIQTGKKAITKGEAVPPPAPEKPATA
ncbi:MAG: YtxH domain-containing protein [Chloroflexota bacterium]